MNDVKNLLTSKTVWGGAIALAAGIAGLCGYTISAADVAQLSELITSIGAIVGGVVAIYGRIKATKKIA